MLRVLFILVGAVMALCIGPTESFSQTYSIRKSVPVEIGDSWRSEIRCSTVVTGEEQRGSRSQQISEKRTSRLVANVTIDQVNANGYATAWIAEVIRFDSSTGRGPSKILLDRGTVVLFDRSRGALTAVLEDGAELSAEQSLIRELLTLPTLDKDVPFEPKQQIQAGQSWRPEQHDLDEGVLANCLPETRQFQNALTTESSGTLVETVTVDGVEYLDIRLLTKSAATAGLEDDQKIIDQLQLQVEEEFRMPAGYETDIVSRETVVTERLLTRGKLVHPSIDLETTTTVSETRTYDKFRGGGVRPWKAAPGSKALLSGLLVGLDFEDDRIDRSSDPIMVRPYGRISEPLVVKGADNAPGKVGNAMRFDGTSSYVNAGPAATILRSGTEAVTVCCWVKGEAAEMQLLFDVGFFGSRSLTLFRKEEMATFHLNPTAGGVALPFPLVLKEWTHVALTWDGAMQRAYVNGLLAAEAQTVKRGRLDTDSLGRQPLLIGTQAKADGRRSRFFNGQMDEFGIWTRALTPGEVAAVYESGVRGRSIFAED